MHETTVVDQARLAEEQAALRRVATLVAQQPSPEEVFTAVTEEVGPLLGADLAAMLAFPDGEPARAIAGWSAAGPIIPIGTRLALDGESVTGRIFRTAAPGRMDDYAGVDGATADYARGLGLRSTVGAPIVVDGKLWGALMVATRGAEPLRETTETRLAAFTELVATAISNVESRSKLQRLATEQEALRTAATLVASGASPAEVFGQITASASEVFGVPFASLIRMEPGGPATMVAGCLACSAYVGMSWEVPDDDPGIARAIVTTGQPARIEDHSRVAGPVGEAARSLGVGSVVGAPVVVDGTIWGILAVGASQDGPPLGPDVGERLVAFTELVTTTLINAESREEVRSLLHEQETLRRVATRIAQGADPDTVFAAVCDEAVDLFDIEQAAVVRLEPDRTTLLTVGISAGVPGTAIGMRAQLGEWPTSSVACSTGRTARRDVSAGEQTGSGFVPDLVRSKGFLSTVSAPITVEGCVWGAMTVSDSRRALPVDMERRIENFTELIATAIANREARDEVTRLLDEQSSLRRVATLVAESPVAEGFFSAVAREVAGVLKLSGVCVDRFAEDGTTVTVGTAYDGDPRGAGDGNGCALVRDAGVVPTVEVPVVVGGRVWGRILAAAETASLPKDAEARIASFAELLATAVENIDSREALAASEARSRALASEQAALRRVATRVAQGAGPDEVFSVVAAEVAGLIDIPVVGINRYEADGTFTMLGIVGDTRFEVGSRWHVQADGIGGEILATGRPARRDDYSRLSGTLADAMREDGMVSTVGVPIVVDGGVWGFMVAAARPGRPIPTDTEEQLVRFTELVATAVSNATTRTELLTSRARVVGAADETRRKLERDLHDGIQQWLVALALRARRAARLATAGEPAVDELTGLADDLVAVTDELREISRGIHPAILSDAGLDDALVALARRSAIRVDLDVAFGGRFDPTLEATVYYIVAESITNAVKHAQASLVSVRGGRRGGTIELEIHDDGVGGADPRRGTGLIGLEDRVDTLGGTITCTSPVGAGTTIRVKLPMVTTAASVVQRLQRAEALAP